MKILNAFMLHVTQVHQSIHGGSYWNKHMLSNELDVTPYLLHDPAMPSIQGLL